MIVSPLPRGTGVVEVALESLRRADLELTFGTDVDNNACLRVHHAALDAREGTADAAANNIGRVAATALHKAAQWREMRRCDLGAAKCLDNRGAQRHARLLLKRLVQGCRCAERATHGRQVRLLHLGIAHEPQRDGRCDGEEGHAVLLHRREESRGRETGERHDAAARGEDGQEVPQRAVDVM